MKRMFHPAGLIVFLVSAFFVQQTLAQAPRRPGGTRAGGGGAKKSGAPIDIRKISGEKVRSPQYQFSGSSKSGRSKEWFRITTTYDTDPEWIDELRIQYYVLVKGKREQTLFQGSVTYVNVEEDNRHESAVFLHPNTLKRYGNVQAVAVLIYYKGKPVAIKSEPSSNQRWWEAKQPRDGFILKRMETPFAMVNFDTYEAVKSGSGGR